MSKFITIKKGFDIRLVGKAENTLSQSAQPELFAVKPTDFPGLNRPKLLVNQGDTVKAGTPLFYDKALEQVMYVAPVSGEVVEVERGEKRKILAIKILADKEVVFETQPNHSVSDLKNLSGDEVRAQLVKSGIWPMILQRPYGIVANPEDRPKSIFISAFDSHPLSPDYAFALKGEEQNFQAGLSLLKKLTDGHVHLNIDANAEVAQVFAQAKEVQINKIKGPHPAGNVGVQIHHIDPINKGEIVWTIDPYGVVQIGKYFLSGKYDCSQLVAITGSEVNKPQYYKTFSGACIDKVIKDNLKQEHVRCISGNILTGENIGAKGFLGFYHHSITVIPEGDYHEFLGWIKPSTKKLSIQRAIGLLSFLNPKKEYKLDTNLHGEHRAFVQTGLLEKVTPMDILPTFLLKAILAENYDEMEALGIFEVIEEDMALCEFVDVSKHPIQSIIRDGINLMIES